MKEILLSCLIAFSIYVIATALVVVPITLAIMLSWWWLLLYIATIPTLIAGREFILSI
jgi:hypothetical protein